MIAILDITLGLGGTLDFALRNVPFSKTTFNTW
jgi:hypothetical protein